MQTMDAVVIAVFGALAGAVVLYGVIRLAVAHGIRDARRAEEAPKD